MCAMKFSLVISLHFHSSKRCMGQNSDGLKRDKQRESDGLDSDRLILRAVTEAWMDSLGLPKELQTCTVSINYSRRQDTGRGQSEAISDRCKRM